MYEKILQHAIDRIMEKITDEHPFWRFARFLAAIVGGAWAIRLALDAVDQEAFTRDAGLSYALILAWYVACFWALPNVFEGFNSRKWFWLGWLVVAAAAIAVDVFRLISGNWEPFVKTGGL